jgi:hypothetical protein
VGIAGNVSGLKMIGQNCTLGASLAVGAALK